MHLEENLGVPGLETDVSHLLAQKSDELVDTLPRHQVDQCTATVDDHPTATKFLNCTRPKDRDEAPPRAREKTTSGRPRRIHQEPARLAQGNHRVKSASRQGAGRLIDPRGADIHTTKRNHGSSLASQATAAPTKTTTGAVSMSTALAFTTSARPAPLSNDRKALFNAVVQRIVEETMDAGTEEDLRDPRFLKGVLAGIIRRSGLILPENEAEASV